MVLKPNVMGHFDRTLEGPQGGGEEEQEQKLRQHRTSFWSLAAEFPLGTDISPPTQGHGEPPGPRVSVGPEQCMERPPPRMSLHDRS